MTLSKRLLASAGDIWDSYYTHPFVAGIGSGTLPIEKFRYFMLQDYLYLYEYARVFALGVVKTDDHALMRTFAAMTQSTLEGEMQTHHKYMERLGITAKEVSEVKASLVNTSYTNYMLSVAYSGNALDILTAVLSCAWSYMLIGQKLAQIPGSTDHPFYGEWILSYAGDEYAALVAENIQLVDQLGENISQSDWRRLEDIFIRCSRYEKQFWEMSWNMEN